MKHPIGLKERGQYTWRQMKKYKVSYGFIAPFMIIFVLFTVAPVIIAMFFSLTNFNVLQPARFVGLENYKNLFIKDPLFLIAINSPHYHTTPHWHEKIYNAQYPDGIKINHRTDVNTPLGDK